MCINPVSAAAASLAKILALRCLDSSSMFKQSPCMRAMPATHVCPMLCLQQRCSDGHNYDHMLRIKLCVQVCHRTCWRCGEGQACHPLGKGCCCVGRDHAGRQEQVRQSEELGPECTDKQHMTGMQHSTQHISIVCSTADTAHSKHHMRRTVQHAQHTTDSASWSQSNNAMPSQTYSCDRLLGLKS